MKKFTLDELPDFMVAGFSGVAVDTTEPTRLDVTLSAMAAKHQWLIGRWDATGAVGLDFYSEDGQVTSTRTSQIGWSGTDNKPLPLGAVLDSIGGNVLALQTGRESRLADAYAELTEQDPPEGEASRPLRMVFVIHDADTILKAGNQATPSIVRRLLKAVEAWKPVAVMFLLVGDHVPLTPSLEHEVVRLDFPLPGEAERAQEVSECLVNAQADNKRKGNDDIDLGSTEDRRKLVSAGSGMSRYEFQNALFLAVSKHKSFGAQAAETMFSMKVGALESGGVLKYIPAPAGGYANVGGLDAVKTWMQAQTTIMRTDCKAYGINQPKGVLLAGIAGNGKTLLAGAIASEAGKPLFKANMDALSASVQGETESRTAKLLDTLDTLGDCVVLIDEIEKFFSKQGLEGHNASPAHQKAFGRVLNWLSERDGGAYLVATANNLDLLPTPLMRRQRWDELFWVDNPKDPLSVIRVIFSRMRRQDAFDAVEPWLKNFAAKTLKDWSGAELECLCHQAAKTALVAGKLPLPEEDKDGEWVKLFFEQEAAPMYPMERLKAAEYAENRKRSEGVMRDAQGGDILQAVRDTKTTRKIS